MNLKIKVLHNAIEHFHESLTSVLSHKQFFMVKKDIGHTRRLLLVCVGQNKTIIILFYVSFMLLYSNIFLYCILVVLN